MNKICISKNWQLSFGQKNSICVPVDLPNDYAISKSRDPNAPGGASNGFFLGGDGTYTKELSLENKHYILDIDGGYMCTAVKLNNTLLSIHPHGYTPHLVDLTETMKPNAENTLAITTHAHQPSTRWYTGAGLYRDVFLWEGGDVRLEPWDVFVTTPTTDSVHVAYEVSSDREASLLLRATVLDAEGNTVKVAENALSVIGGQKNPVSLAISMENAKLWDTETPYLYTLRSEILENGKIIESDERRFGIRTIAYNSHDGLVLNGKSIKLRGGCIHHDHGVLGAAEFPAACRRKLTKLKEVGFNAIRSAHNPPSTVLLDLCDEMGIILMDEAFDCWRIEKGGNLNYHAWFDDHWARDIAAMVLRDRAHPCVFSYSIGNEIPEADGMSDGDKWAKLLSDEIRKYDTTRPVTSAVWEMGDKSTWAERTKNYFAVLDICGYNYAFRRLESDHELFPERVIWLSETKALPFYQSWKMVCENSHVIGDFTWVAYDNIGEAGTGRALWARDGKIPGISLAEYPWRTCYQGDFDLCGHRRPQSFFREAIWVGGKEPKIFTTHPEHYGEDYTGTGWHWYDVLDTWTFDNAYLGKPVKCEVYTDADEIEWILNGNCLGRSTTVQAISTIDIPYEPGTLEAIAYKNGNVVGRSSLRTVGEAASLKVVPESTSFKADNRDLCYFDITITDKDGNRVPNAQNELVCLVDGGELMGIFSGDPKNEDEYTSRVCHAFEGRAVAIVRTKNEGKVTLTVGSTGLLSGSATASAL